MRSKKKVKREGNDRVLDVLANGEDELIVGKIAGNKNYIEYLLNLSSSVIIL